MNSFPRTLACLPLLFCAMATAAPDASPDSQSERTEYQLTLEEMRTFTEVFERVKRDYVEAVDDRTLMQAAIRGMLSDLDPHTAYLDHEEYEQLEEGTSGRFEGIGIEVVMSNGDLRIVSPIDGTPAAEAGVKPGDVITAIDGESTADLTLEQAVKRMRGEPGTKVGITLRRGSEDELLEMELERAVVRVQSVRTRMLEPGYGYLRITAFQSDTASSARRALTELEAEHGGSLRGLVMDLRSNPGGVLNSAVSVADHFLDEGLIVYTEGRAEGGELRFSADTDMLAANTPMVILIDGGTASASEIVAGALQDHGRAVVLGEQSFGKGSVQTVLPLNNGSAVKLTTARYYTPNGRSIQARGIRPDIHVGAGSFTEADNGPGRREADLAGHLEGEAVEGIESAARIEELAASDFQLYQALNVLKGASILSRNSHDQGE